MAREGADPEFADLVALHNRLAEMIAPALPRTITLLREDPSQGRWLAVLGALPTIRRLTCLSLIFTGLFMLSALSGHVNEASMRSGILTMSGLDLLEVLVFILAAAGMGACFQALFTAQRYVVAGTYDPRHDSDYWTRIVLGLTAGLMLAELIPHDKMGEQGQLMAKPLLALLGGFSASLVYRVLARLVETVEGLFAGDARDRTQALTQAARAQTTALTARQRMETATSLLGLQERLARGGTPQEMSQAVGELIRTLVPDSNSLPSNGFPPQRAS